MDLNNFFENQIFSLHICLCTPKNKAFFEMWLLNANLKCTCTQNLHECLTFSHCALFAKSFTQKQYMSVAQLCNIAKEKLAKIVIGSATPIWPGDGSKRGTSQNSHISLWTLLSGKTSSQSLKIIDYKLKWT